MLVVLLAATLAVVAATDQYEHHPLVGQHRFQLPQRAVPELQIGCEDGAVHHRPGPVLQVLKRLKRQAEQRRQRRDYIQWYGSTGSAPYPQPKYIQTYQIHSAVPYYVPVWGNPRRIPIFFPAKPILFNPGYPARNPPGRIPPTTEAPPVTDSGLPITIGSRINLNEAGEPIWGIVEAEPPSNSISTTRRPPASSAARPTRPPSPPLLHRPSLGEEPNRRPNLSDRDNQIISQSAPQDQFRPLPTTTTQAPTQSGNEAPNRCVWAIISCCNPSNSQISYNCFETLGCPGAFWDNNPCSKEVTTAALNAAAKFYEQT